MTDEVIVVPELDLSRKGASWPAGLAERVTTFLDQSLPYQHDRDVFTRHNPEGGAVLIKVIRKEATDVQARVELAKDAADFDRAYDYVFAWDRGSSTEDGETPQLYAYCALGKLRATARTGTSTAELIELRAGGVDYFDEKNLIVIDDENGVMQAPERRVYGDFPYKGAVIVENERFLVVVSMSGFNQNEDHIVAKYIADYILERLDQLTAA